MAAAIIGLSLLVLAGCTGEATRTEAGGEVSTGPDGAQEAQLTALDTALGQAYLDEPLAGATVEIYDDQDQVIDAAGGVYDTTTNPDGVFTVDPQRLPADFTVVVTDGLHGDAVFDGILYREVEGYEGWETLGVNSFTTLVAVHHHNGADRSLAAADDEVRRYLGLGHVDNVDGLEVGTSDTWFSEATVAEVDQATAGDYDEFVDGVAEGIDPGATRSFAAPATNQLAEAAALFTILISVAEITAIVNCTENQDSYNLDNVSACIMGRATDPELVGQLDEIHARLREVSDSLSDLGHRQEAAIQQVGQNNWSQIVDRLDDRYFRPTRTAWDHMTCATDAAFQVATRQMCQEAAREITRRLHQEGAARHLADELTGAQGGRVPVVRAMADQARLASGRFYRSPNQVSTGGDAPGALQEAWRYIDANQASLVFLLLTFLNTQPDPDRAFIQQTVVAPYLGVPASVPGSVPRRPYGAGERAAPDCPPTNVRADTCRGSREQALRLVPQALPEGAVVDTATGLMWLQNIGSRNGEGQAPAGGVARNRSGYNRDAGTGQLWEQQMQPACDAQTWARRDGAECPAAWRVSNVAADVGAGLPGWRTPTRAELERLTRRGIDGAPTGTTVGDWLSTAGGFHWVFGPVDQSRSDLTERPVRTAGTEVCLYGQAGRVCSRADGRAYTSTSNGQNVICGEGAQCVSGAQNHAVDLLTGEPTMGEVYRNDAQGLWTMAVRPLAPCEFYYDNVRGPSPADAAGCEGPPPSPSPPTTTPPTTSPAPTSSTTPPSTEPRTPNAPRPDRDRPLPGQPVLTTTSTTTGAPTTTSPPRPLPGRPRR